MTRRWFSTFFHIALVTILSACGEGNRGTTSEPCAGRPDSVFRVALLTPGPITDQSWNTGAYQGLLRIRDSLGAQTSHIQTRTPAEFEENFREYGRQCFHLVFGHGFEFQDAARRVAPDYPRTTYVVTSSNLALPNAIGIRFAFEEPSYLAGMIAGAITKTGTIGAVGGTELPPVRVGFAAFAAGAKATRPNVRVLTSYVGNWDDASAGKEQALAQIARGADVIYQNADAAGLGVFQAARETNRALVFGSNGDQNSVAPDVIIGSVVIDLPHAFFMVARRLKESGLPAEVVHLGGRTDVVRVALNPALAHRVPAAVRAQVDSVWNDILSDRINVQNIADRELREKP